MTDHSFTTIGISWAVAPPLVPKLTSGKQRLDPSHFPMQNSAKSESRTASVPIAPVTRPSAAAAALRSSAASSSSNGSASGSAAALPLTPLLPPPWLRGLSAASPGPAAAAAAPAFTNLQGTDGVRQRRHRKSERAARDATNK